MAENPRDYIRAAQAAELNGDPSGAADLLHRAAAVYARSGSLSRALQLLRRARKLDGKREDIADTMQRLERESESERAPEQASSEQDAALAEGMRLAPSSVEEASEQQRLIEEALRAVDAGWDEEDGPRRWGVEEIPPSELPSAIEWAVRSVPDLPPARNTWELEDMDVRLQLTPVANEEPLSSSEHEAPSASDKEARAHLIERGPTRADPALAAWCSFCCRPRTEVGELVAGPAGAFICRACVSESNGLLGDVKAVPRPVLVPAAPEEAKPEAPELVGQDEARALLAQALEAGLRRVLLLGPEGVGKTTWLQSLQARGQGAFLDVSALEQVPSAEVLLVEDVERLDPDAQTALAAFLARHPERTVLMTARGSLKPSSRVLRGGEARLPLHTTAALGEAVGGAVSVALLEQVQLAVPLQVPTKAELVEMARRALAPRRPAVSVSEEVLTTLAAEALRSPRAGHELRALLARVPSGSWTFEAPKAKKKAPVRRGRRKKERT